MSAKRGTAEGDSLDVLVTLVEAWERQPRLRILVPQSPLASQQPANMAIRGGVTPALSFTDSSRATLFPSLAAAIASMRYSTAGDR